MAFSSEAVIIVAGGSGSRMGSAIPKQFLPLNGVPVVVRTIRQFLASNPNMLIVLVLPETEQLRWNEIATMYPECAAVRTATGGATRFHSVKNGLEIIAEAEIVAVHDAVRPLVSSDTIRTCLATAREFGSAIPVIDVQDSIRRVRRDGSNKSVQRSDYKIVQTPQCFRSDWLKKSYQQPYIESFTDDASVVEQAGYAIALVPGHRDNIKITTPEDLLWVETICTAGKKSL